MAGKNRMHRSMLSVPGSNLELIGQAPTLGADVVFLDLEDGVTPADKDQARLNIIHALRTQDWSKCTVSVRINGLDTPQCYRDVIDVVEQAGECLDTILIPKVNDPSDVIFVVRLLEQIEMSRNMKPVGIEVLIETAPGMTRVEEIARCCPERLEAMSFGVSDYSLSTRMRLTQTGGPIPNYTMLSDPDSEGTRHHSLVNPWHYPWSRMIAACRANDLRPIDGPFGNIPDTEGYLAVAHSFASLGGEGKWAVHPAQIALANQVFTPTEKEVTRAQRIVAAYKQVQSNGRGVVTLDGRMVDASGIRQSLAVVEKLEWLASIQSP
ncbi:MAG TPA: CoA ester lyase [Thiobacillus sp.]